MKRFFDFTLSLVVLVLIFPVIALVALLVFKQMGSPILFKQKRPGLRGKPFVLYKFRSMISEKDSDSNLLSEEMRMTTMGNLLRKFSLDELPQLINVLKGDMSFVGPRPLLMDYLPLYNMYQLKRHEVRPGITGWAQVNGRNAITWEERFNLDAWYVENRSFQLDCKILFLTVIKTLKSEGISQDGHISMPFFKGEDPNAE